MRVERSGAERIFQRIAQEQGSGIKAVDVANSTDPAHYLEWKKNDWLAPYLPDDVARHFPADQIDPDGMYATSCAWTEAIGYNTNLVKREDAPKSYADLLDPKWQGKMVKAHPGYSGAILTATFLLARDLGWPYLEKLGQQKIMQVQSAADPPKKILLGERAVMADGNDYNLVLLKDQGKPVEVVYPAEGSPLIIVPSGIFRSAPNPNAARLFQSFFFSAEAQQMLVDVFAHRSFHGEVKEKGGHVPLSSLKLLKADPAAGAGAKRGDQGALHQNLRRVMPAPSRAGNKPEVIATARICILNAQPVTCWTNHKGDPYQVSSVLLRAGKCGIANLKSGKQREDAAALPAAADMA